MERQYGYVIEAVRSGIPQTATEFFTAEVTWNEAALRAFAKALGRFIKPCELHVYCSCGYVRSNFGANLPVWADAGFPPDKMAGIASAGEWKLVWEYSRCHRVIWEDGASTYRDWMLAEMRKERKT